MTIDYKKFTDALGLIVASNQQGVVNALNSVGILADMNTSPSDLVQKLVSLFNIDKAKFQTVINAAPFNRNAFTPDQLVQVDAYLTSLKDSNPNAKSFDWTNPQDYINFVVGGSETNTVVNPTITTSKPGLSPTVIISLAVFGILAITGIVIYSLKRG